MDNDKKTPQRYDAEKAEMALTIAYEQVELKKAQAEMAKRSLSDSKPEGEQPEEKKAEEAERKEEEDDA